jgi:hypothetical protein
LERPNLEMIKYLTKKGLFEIDAKMDLHKKNISNPLVKNCVLPMDWTKHLLLFKKIILANLQ